ncbi:MAG TPA: LysM domain-containing protein [Polyangiaceae bacterium]|nr:LysM domain-containing protein [Polyangiaceae bacterium]
MSKWLRTLALVLGLWFAPSPASALVHVVQPGDTLAAVAERYYGRIQYERILVAANRLDLAGGTPLVPGMHLLIPTVSYVTTAKGETWATLAQRHLGSSQRSDVLSLANGSNPWLIPEEGTRILVPYNLAVLLSSDESIVSIAQKYLGDAKQAWPLTHYNNLKKGQLERGTVVLVPITDLELTEAVRATLTDPERIALDVSANERRSQRKIATEIPALIADIRNGRYIDAVARGNRFVASGLLSVPQQSLVMRQLLEAYVALDSSGAAAAACAEWRKLDPTAKLDPTQLSPKILTACGVTKK